MNPTDLWWRMCWTAPVISSPWGGVVFNRERIYPHRDTLPQGGGAHVQRPPLLLHISDLNAHGEGRMFGGGLLTSPHPTPHIFYKDWVVHEEVLDCCPGLLHAPLSVSVQQIPYLLSQCYNDELVSCQVPVKRDMLVHGLPHRLLNTCCLLVLLPYELWYGAPQICENISALVGSFRRRRGSRMFRMRWILLSLRVVYFRPPMTM